MTRRTTGNLKRRDESRRVLATHEAISGALGLISQGIEHLKLAFPQREFTIDGRLVGDIGEVIAALENDITLNVVSQPGHDGRTSDGRNVQIKATFKDSLTFGTVPEYYLGFKLYKSGEYEEVFNGPGKLISEHYSGRKYIGVKPLSFPVAQLRQLSRRVSEEDRISKRDAREDGRRKRLGCHTR